MSKVSELIDNISGYLVVNRETVKSGVFWILSTILIIGMIVVFKAM